MRFFIALEIPEQDRQGLQELQRQIAEIIPDMRLSEPEKLHLTLAFLGDHPDELQRDLTEALRKACLGIKPFAITPAYIDAFPNIHHPRTFWVGVKGDVDSLVILRERIKDEVSKLGLPVDERRFVPHVKIGTGSGQTISQENEERLQQLSFDGFAPVSVTAIKLFESVPEGSLHRHNTLAEVTL
jgi:2'-5' RNA ligase